MRFLPFPFIALILIAVPVVGAETAWSELAPGVRARLIASEVRRADGTTLVGLEVEMPGTTKTYWRVPGEAGIPTEIDVAGSSGVERATILWPYPSVDTSNGYLEYVYFGDLVLPVELAVAGDAPELVARVTMGVCDKVCVPAMTSFTLPLDFAAPDSAQSIRLAQALATTPVPWTERRDAIATLVWDGAANGLRVGLGDAGVDWASIIADMGDASALFGTPQKSPDGRTILLPLLGGGDPAAVLGEQVQLTFLTPMGPFETSRRIAP